MEKGQVTLFVIAGIVIAVVLFAGYYLFQQVRERSQEAGLAETAQLNEQERAVFEVAAGCLQKVLEEGTYTVAVSGGFSHF